MDKSGTFVATSCTDKTLCVYDFNSEELLATMFGHSELVTGLRFTNDSKYLISASGDGCIFVWRMPTDMIKHANSNKKKIQSERYLKKIIINMDTHVVCYNKSYYILFYHYVMPPISVLNQILPIHISKSGQMVT